MHMTSKVKKIEKRHVWIVGLLLVVVLALFLFFFQLDRGVPRSLVSNIFSPCDIPHGGSVYVTLSGTLSHSVPGSKLGVVAILHNTSVDTVQDGVLYVRVYKGAYPNDLPRVIDEFVASQFIDIPAEGIVKRSFSWRVPYDADASTYQLEGYIASPRDPFISAPSDMPSAQSSTYAVTLVSPTSGTVHIDPTSIKIGTVNAGGTDLVEFTRGESLLVSAKVINPTAIPYEGDAVSHLYSTAASPLGSPTETQTSDVRVHPHSSTTIAFTLSPLTQQSYYLQVRLQKGNTKQSLVGKELVQKGLCTQNVIVKAGLGVLKMLLGALLLLVIVAALWMTEATRKDHV